MPTRYLCGDTSGAVDLAAAGASFDIAAADALEPSVRCREGVASTSVVLGHSLTFGDGADENFCGFHHRRRLSLIKQGTGTQTLAGSSNYGGDTQINESATVLGPVDPRARQDLTGWPAMRSWV